MENKKEIKNNNKLGIASLVLFLIALCFTLSMLLNKSEEVISVAGFAFVFYALPLLLISGIMALINIIKYYSKSSYKCNKFFLIATWAILLVLILYVICLYVL